MKRQATDQQKIIANYVSDKGIISRIHKEHLYVNKKTNQFFRKGKIFETLQKKIQEW